MMPRHKFLDFVMTSLSATAFAWFMYIFKAHENRYLRSAEFTQVVQSLQELSNGMDPSRKDQLRLAQSVKNLEGISEGAIMIEENAIHIAAFLMLLTFGFSLLNLLHRDPQSQALTSPDQSGDDSSSVAAFQGALAQTIAELDHIKSRIAKGNSAVPSADGAASALESSAQDIVGLESQLVFIRSQAQGLAEQNSKSLENLQRLSGQADDFSKFAAASRLEWNGLAVKLSQFKESQDLVRGEAEMLDRIQQSCQDQLTKSLKFAGTHSAHSERARADANRMYADSKSTTEVFSKLIQAMSESNGDVDLANKLVRRLSERAEEIVNIIDVIDDIAEQTNQLALNASIEAARAGEQGKGFAVVAAEVRNLAVRSSTATRSITELLETIQVEADKASSCLEKTNASVGTAHERIVDVDHRCRETMNLSRQVASELTDLIRVTNEHTQDIATVEKQSLDVSRMTTKLIRHLDEVDQINASIHQESNQLALHTDRLSRLMSRQYFAIQYSERMAAGQTEAFASLIGHSTQLLGRTESLRSGFEDKYRMAVMRGPQPRAQDGNDSSELAHRLAYCQTNLAIIQGRTQSSSVSIQGDGGRSSAESRPLTDDDDINIDSNLQKVS